MPLMSRRLRISEYTPLLAKIESRLRGWSAKILSFAGRTQLLASVIYGMANFWMSAFILPKGCVKGIEALCARFLWSGKVEAKYSAKIAWEDVCLPKEEGGLGLRRLGEWNRTLCLKLIWLLFGNSGSLWVGWHKHHNLKKRSLWEVEMNPAKSWTWNKLLQIRPLALQFIRGKLGNGKRLSFWFDNWSPFGQLLSFIGNQGPGLGTGTHYPPYTRYLTRNRLTITSTRRNKSVNKSSDFITCNYKSSNKSIFFFDTCPVT